MLSLSQGLIRLLITETRYVEIQPAHALGHVPVTNIQGFID